MSIVFEITTDSPDFNQLTRRRTFLCNQLLNRTILGELMKKVIQFGQEVRDGRVHTKIGDGKPTDLLSILSSSPHIGAFIVQDRKFVYVNDHGCRNMAATPNDFLGKDSLSFVHNDDKELLRENSMKTLRGEHVPLFEFRIINRDGRTRWVLGTYVAIVYKGRKAVLGYYIDVSNMRQIDELYATLTESSQIAFFVAQDGKIVFANPKGAEQAGCKLDELIGLNSQTFIHPEDKDRVREQGIRMLKGESIPPIEFRYINKSGKLRWGIGMMTPIDYKGRRAVLGNYIDITERKLVEVEVVHSRQQLRDLTAHLQSIREEERTRIAHEIHDELGQILTILKIDLSWISKRLTPNQKDLIEKTKAMSRLVDMSLQTTKRISMELRPGLLEHLGLAAAIEWQAEEFQRRTGIQCTVKNTQDEIVWDQKLSTAICNIIQEVLLNIIRHANATKVEIELGEQNGKLEFFIRDNGKGITEDQICKPNSFGLIGIKERVRSLGGSLEISGKKRKGTTVTVRIPVSRKEHKIMVRILVADAHPILLEGLKQIISDTPDMMVTGEAKNTFELFENVSKNEFDIVLLDMSMRGRNGWDIIKNIKLERPRLPILVLSMYSEDQYAIRALKAGASGYLTKQSAADELIAAIRKVSQGRKYISSALAEKLAYEVDVFSVKPPHEKLSTREYQIMLMIASGKTVGEVAGELCLSVKTISTYRTRILEKMNLKNNAELTRYAIDERLLD